MTIAKTFDKQYRKTRSGCWIWLRGVNAHGYGSLKVKGRTHVAHRFSYERSVGPIPKGLLVCHACDVRKCVNPAHLFLGTHQDNKTDSVNKGRASGGRLKHPMPGEKNPRAKLTWKKVGRIRALARAGHRQIDIAKAFKTPAVTVNHIVTGRTWRV